MDIQPIKSHPTKQRKVVIPNHLVEDILSQPNLAIKPNATLATVELHMAYDSTCKRETV